MLKVTRTSLLLDVQPGPNHREAERHFTPNLLSHFHFYYNLPLILSFNPTFLFIFAIIPLPFVMTLKAESVSLNSFL